MKSMYVIGALIAVIGFMGGFIAYQDTEIQTLEQHHEWAVEFSNLSVEDRAEVKQSIYEQKQGTV